MPGMKDYVSVRGESGRIHRQKRLILCNLKELYESFKKEMPNAQVGFSTFASIRPQHCVLAAASGTHSVCVCPMHQNLKLMVRGKSQNIFGRWNVVRLKKCSRLQIIHSVRLLK